MSKPPKLNPTFFCIANREENILTAIVSSHISSKDEYPLVFSFSEVTHAKDYKSLNTTDEHQISRSRATTLDIDLSNTLKRIGGCEYLILVGLSENQKTYLSFTETYNVIEIATLDDICTFIQPISAKETIPCKEGQVYEGLQLASTQGKAIKIDENAEVIELKKRNKGGLIVTENDNSISTVVATNYAISINADIEIIEPFKFHEKKFLELIEPWREEVKNGKEEKSLKELKALIYGKINHINFLNHDFVTFFTIGAPYSLIIENIIPSTYVGLKLNPDFFIFNNICFQDDFNIDSAIVFSPRFFSIEETDFVINKLRENHYEVNELIKENATSHNLDFYVKELPFNILHLCGHGNQSEGSLIEERYVDQFGKEHIFEYFITWSFSPGPGRKAKNGEPLIKVTKKIFPKKLNGFSFRTKEFKEQNFASSIFPKMINTVPVKKNQISSKRVTLENSHEIACHTFSHLGLFSHLAAGHSPLIFNNTCWSAFDIKNHLITVRARVYIGTLWNINNSVAFKSAESFYSSLFDETILEALQKSMVHSKNTKDQDIYIFYGLHFTKLKKGSSIANSKRDVAIRLLQSLDTWKGNLSRANDDSIKENIEDLIGWNTTLITKKYRKELLEIIGKEKLMEYVKKNWI
ncbi:hypothetical protein [Maribacter sp. R77961]|uniref:hypothetical protein n=1 Tax=Maribacter sp. R77961 TaxID=3093871 RepID=UPI0037C67373